MITTIDTHAVVHAGSIQRKSQAGGGWEGVWEVREEYLLLVIDEHSTNTKI